MSTISRERSRNRARGAAALRLSREGRTHRQIAEQLGLKPHQVKGMIALGERFEEHTMPASTGQGDSQ